MHELPKQYDHAAAQARCRTLFASFRLRVQPLLDNAEAKAAFDDLGRAIESERGGDSLAACLRLHGMAMARLFGDSAEDSDFHEAAGRADMRLGAWCWIAREAAARKESLDESSRMIVALLGLYYLGSGI